MHPAASLDRRCGSGGAATGTAAPAPTAAASTTTAAASPACADAAALKASVAELDQLDPAQAGKAGIQAALDKVALGLLDDHARHCLAGEDPAEKTDELMAAVGRLMRRG